MREIYRAGALGLSYSAYSQPFVREDRIFRCSDVLTPCCPNCPISRSSPHLRVSAVRFCSAIFGNLFLISVIRGISGKVLFFPSSRCIYNLRMPIPFAEYATRVQEHLERDWGIPVVTRDIPDPLTGDLDGAEIDVDYAITPEQRLFLLGHLFGHTVQWNVNESAFDLGRQYKPPVDEALFPEVLAYEGEAARYGLQLLHQIGINDVDQWFSNYTAADQAYLLHFYRTGDKGEFKNFWL